MKYTAYASRSQTDVLFAPVGGSAEYTGILADAIGWVEQAELMDPALWALFVEQFRIGNADDSNLGWRNEFWGKMMRGACVLLIPIRKTKSCTGSWSGPCAIF